MRFTIRFFFFFFCALEMSVYAQDDENDATFNTFNNCATNGSGFDLGISTIIPQPDGKIIVGGSFTFFNSEVNNRIIRLNSDGTKDTSFVTFSGFSSNVRTLSLQNDGKILAGGDFTTYRGINNRRVSRLNSDGTIDSTFILGAGVNSGLVLTSAVQPDGKIIYAGQILLYQGLSVPRIMRLNSNASIDNTFTPGTGFNDIVNKVLMQPDGKILVGGIFTSFNGTSRNRIARLNSDGTLDNTFNPGTGFDSTVYDISLQADGKIIVAGIFNNFNGTVRPKIIRINQDGSIDMSFNPGTGFDNWVNNVEIQADGKILAGGQFITFNGISVNRIVRLNPNGSYDTSFNTGTGFDSNVIGIAIQSDGRILCGGSFSSYNGKYRNRIARLNADGTPDSTFNITRGFNFSVITLSVQSDDKVIVGGSFTAFNDRITNRILRLNPDGLHDLSYNTGTGFNNTVLDVIVQSDGKVIAAGDFTSFNGISRNRIARLNTDGSLDLSFNPGIAFDSTVQKIAIQADGKIIAVGDFISYNGIPSRKIIRINPNGTSDASFNVGTGFNLAVYEIKLQTDGKILVGGNFTLYNGVSSNGIIRLNANGTIDSGFNTGLGTTGPIKSILIQGDGKIICGGIFTSFNAVPTGNIVRLNSDGTIDNGFNSGTGFSSQVNVLCLAENGKILVGGFFTSYNAVARSRIAKLNTDGSLDLNFDPLTGFNNMVEDFAEQSNGKIIVGGRFLSYRQICRNSIMRLETVSNLPLDITEFNLSEQNGVVDLEWITSSETNLSHFTIEHSSDAINFDSLGFREPFGMPSQVTRYSFVDDKPNSGLNYYRIKSTDLDGTISASKVEAIEISKGEMIRVYPNPINQDAILNIESDFNINCITIFNFEGRSTTKIKTSGKNIELSNKLSKGIYFIVIESDKQTKIIKRLTVK